MNLPGTIDDLELSTPASETLKDLGLEYVTDHWCPNV